MGTTLEDFKTAEDFRTAIGTLAKGIVELEQGQKTQGELLQAMHQHIKALTQHVDSQQQALQFALLRPAGRVHDA